MSTARALRLLAALLFALVALPAHASHHDLGDLSLEQLLELRTERVVSASRYEQKVTRAPASVTVVTADEIRRAGYRTLADVLRGIRGLYVANDRNYSYLGMRGFLRPGDYNGRVLLLLDGHRMNENVYDGGYIDRGSMIDVAMIERVEIVRGPGAAIYGDNAFFGVVNVISRSGAALSGSEAALTAGSRDAFGERLAWGSRRDGGPSLALSASHYASAGEPRLYYAEFDPALSSDPRARNGGVARDLDGEEAGSVYARASHGAWSAAAFSSTRNKDVPTAAFGTIFDQPGFNTVDRRVYLDLGWRRASDAWGELALRAAWDRYGYYGDYPLDAAPPGEPPQPVINRDEAHGEWATLDAQWTQPLAAGHTLLLGLEYHDNFRQDQFNYDAGRRSAPYLSAPASSRILSAYAQGEVRLGDRLTASAGLRLDHPFGSYDPEVNPRLALIWAPQPATSLKALYGTAFRAPNVYERYYYYASQAAQPALRPESIRTTELVAEHFLDADRRLALSVYQYDIADLVSQVTMPDDEVYFANLDRARGRGVELEAAGRTPGRLDWRLSGALQRATDGATGRELSSSPRHLAQARVLAPLPWDGLWAGIEARYHSSMATLAGTRTQPALVADLTLSARDAAPGLDLSLSLQNVFDRAYAYPASADHLQAAIAQDGRSLLLTATLRFGRSR